MRQVGGAETWNGQVPHPQVWQLRVGRDISAVVVPTEKQGVASCGTTAGKESLYHLAVKTQQGLHVSEMEGYWRPRHSSGAAGAVHGHSQTHSLWAPAQDQQLKKHQGQCGETKLTGFRAGGAGVVAALSGDEVLAGTTAPLLSSSPTSQPGAGGRQI